jgi:hypothetical protein
MACVDKPTDDTIYLLDNLGFAVPCTTDSNNDQRYICSNIMYGKLPIFEMEGDKCKWKLCDINPKTNVIDFNNCKDTTFPYYVKNFEDGCKQTNFLTGDIETIDNDCCCNPESRCDVSQCCEGIGSQDCGSKDFNFFNVGYLENDQQKYLCLPHGKRNTCIKVPPGFEENPEWFPELKAAWEKNDKKFYYSSLCDCVKDNNACERNVLNCVPKEKCSVCNPDEQVAGKWVCKDGECSNPPEGGPYETQADCENNCAPINKFSCVLGECKEDPQGPYFSLDSCINNCISLSHVPFNYDIRSKIIKVLLYVILGIGILILLLILVWVFLFVSKKIKERK